MAAPGTAGVVTALFIHVLLMSLSAFSDTGQILTDSYDLRPSSSHLLIIKQANKHFGFGKHVLAATFIHPHLFGRLSTHTKTTLKPQQTLAFIIAICLLLSGDIHQCPGPLNCPTDENHVNTTANNRSIIDNLQVFSPCSFHTALQQSHLRPCVPPVSDVVSPESRTDEAVNRFNI